MGCVKASLGPVAGRGRGTNGVSLTGRIYFAEMRIYITFHASMPGRSSDPIEQSFLDSVTLGEQP